MTSSASVNAPSGAERGRDEIECVAEVHRQNHDRDDVGIRVVARQTEFDELLRLSRRGRGWMTYPWDSCYFDGRTDPPARVRAYLMNLSRVAGDVPIVQSEDPNISWAQMWPSRSAWPDNKSEHFDTEIAPEGRDVSKFQAWTVDPVAAPAELVGANGYLYPGAFSGWFRWDGGAITGTLFDLGSKDSTIRDRITLAIDQGDLVLRMRDTCGDDTNNIAGRSRTRSASLPRGNSGQCLVSLHGGVPRLGAGDFALLIDGLPRGKRGLLTHLSANLQSISQVGASAVIPVESTDGFPGYGVLEIGDELVEYSKKTAGDSRPRGRPATSPAPTRGRGVRLSKTNTNATHSHQAGEVVRLYGYANRILRDVYPGGGQLSSSLGRFSAGKVRIQQNFSLTPIDAVGPNGFGFPLGKGIKADAQLNTLRLDPLDASDTDFIKAFPATGGYAVMFHSAAPRLSRPPAGPSPVLGAELIQFSGVQGTDTLVGITRNVNPGTASKLFQGDHLRGRLGDQRPHQSQE